MKVAGHIDRADDQLVEGWIFIPEEPSRRIVLQVFCGKNLLGEVTADRFRQDLMEGGVGDGHCAFSYRLPGLLPHAALRDIRLRIADSAVFLLPEDNTMRGALSEPEPAAPAPLAGPEKQGGLWIDRHDFLDRMAEKHRRGEISGDTSLAIFRFVRDGILVIRNAVPPGAVNALNDEIEKIWNDPPDGLLMETFEPEGNMQICPPDIRHRDGRTKLLDLYQTSAAAREVIAAPAVTAFLAAIFEDTPKIFQGLTLWNGKQQTLQKDSAYVRIDGNPIALAGVWTALEDVKPGTGELEYYIGSHRAPDFMFGGMSKWMGSFTGDNERFVQSLHDDAARFGQVKCAFHARKGDVLIWHADLAHADATAVEPKATRRSLLTHFCPARNQPMYRRDSRHQELDSGTCVFVSSHGDVVQDDALQGSDPQTRFAQ